MRNKSTVHVELLEEREVEVNVLNIPTDTRPICFFFFQEFNVRTRLTFLLELDY